MQQGRGPGANRKGHDMATTTHTMRDGFCTICGETEAWLTARGAEMIPADEESFPMGGVRHDDEHSLLTDRKLLPMEKSERHFWCTCGQGFGRMYDSAARKAYRAHRAG